MNDPYQVLKVDRRAEPATIRAAYRALARIHHPDLGGAPGRMVAITQAWAILGNPERRAAYDEQVLEAQGKRVTVPAAPPTPRDSSGNRAAAGQPRAGSGSVIDFGRYAGWTVGSLLDHDPDYLEWLARTQFGRRLAVEIDEALARRASHAAALRPSPAPAQRRRSILRPWATGSSATR